MAKWAGVKPSPHRGEGGPQGRMRGRCCNDEARRVVAPYAPRPATWRAPAGYDKRMVCIVGAACGRLRAGEDTGPYGGYHSLAASQ